MHTLILFFLLLCFPLTASAALVFSVDYEDGTFGPVTRCSASDPKCPSGYQSVPNTDAMGISSTIVRSGAKSVINTAKPFWPICHLFSAGPYINNPICDRSEFEKNTLSTTGTDERWYGFSVYIDPATIFTQQAGNPFGGPGIFQWHQLGGQCGSSPGPHLGLGFNAQGNWFIISSWDTTTPCPKAATFHHDGYELGTATVGMWTDFVFHAKWSTGSNGLLEIWKNGNQILNHTGPNTFNNIIQEAIKWGVYQPFWIGHTPPGSEQIIVLHDNLKVGDANSSFAEVSPGTIPTLTAPTSLAVVVGP